MPRIVVGESSPLKITAEEDVETKEEDDSRSAASGSSEPSAHAVVEKSPSNEGLKKTFDKKSKSPTEKMMKKTFDIAGESPAGNREAKDGDSCVTDDPVPQWLLPSADSGKMAPSEHPGTGHKRSRSDNSNVTAQIENLVKVASEPFLDVKKSSDLKKSPPDLLTVSPGVVSSASSENLDQVITLEEDADEQSSRSGPPDQGVEPTKLGWGKIRAT